MATKDNKVFDVSGPQDATLNIGSKPMVIGHKPSADPTMISTNVDDSDNAPAEKKSTTAVKKVKIEPLNSGTDASTDITSEDDSTKIATTNDIKAEKQPKKSAESKSKAVQTEVSSDENDRDYVAETENEEQSAQDAKEARVEKVEELKKSKKYHVSIKEKHDSAFGKVLALLFAILVSFVGVYALADSDIIPGGELLPMRFIGSNEQIIIETQDNTIFNNDEKSKETSTTQSPTNEVIDDDIVLDEYEADIDNWFVYELEGAAFKLPDGLEFMSGVRTNDVTATFTKATLEEGERASVIPFDATMYEDVLPLVSIGYRTSNNEAGELISDCKTSLRGIGEDEDVSSYVTADGLTIYYRFIRNTVEDNQYMYFTFCSEDEDSQLNIDVNIEDEKDLLLVSAMKKSLETLNFTD